MEEEGVLVFFFPAFFLKDIPSLGLMLWQAHIEVSSLHGTRIRIKCENVPSPVLSTHVILSTTS